jgi:two-component system OmpR family response regulator
MKILLIEDDQSIGQALQNTLKDAAYAVDWVVDAAHALSALKLQEYSLILLDIGLPDKNGFELLHILRKDNITTPTIIVTARDAVDDRIMGLDLGADDYLVKPFDVSELLARIRAVVRRKEGLGQAVFSNEVLKLDPSDKQATYENKNIVLSAREYALLHALMIRPGRILSRDQLENHIYGWNEEVESNAIEFLIYSLRKKLDKSVIKNVRGLGWMVAK